MTVDYSRALLKAEQRIAAQRSVIAALAGALEEVLLLLIERNPSFYTIGLDSRIRAALELARGSRL